MSVTRSQLAAMNPAALGALAEQVGNAHTALNQQAEAHERISRSLPESWRGTAADRAAGDVDDHTAKLRSNTEGVGRLRAALSNAGSDLAAARSKVLGVVSQAESSGFKVGDDWSLTDTSDKRGMDRATTHRDVRDQLRDALSDYHQKDQAAGQATKAALDTIKPVDKGPMHMETPHGGEASGISGDGHGPCDSNLNCHVLGVTDWDDPNMSETQKRNARTIFDVGSCLGMSLKEIQVALMTAMLESKLFNIGDNMVPGSWDKADNYDGPGGQPKDSDKCDPNSKNYDPKNANPNQKGAKCLGHYYPSDPESGGGLFQQHPNGPGGYWGTPDDVMDPVKAATMYYLGNCASNGHMAHGIWYYTRELGIRPESVGSDVYLYDEVDPKCDQARDPNKERKKSSDPDNPPYPENKKNPNYPGASTPWSIAQAINRPCISVSSNGGNPEDNNSSYAREYPNAVKACVRILAEQTAEAASLPKDQNMEQKHCAPIRDRINSIIQRNESCPEKQTYDLGKDAYTPG